jgi:hypothetical protein
LPSNTEVEPSIVPIKLAVVAAKGPGITPSNIIE